MSKRLFHEFFEPAMYVVRNHRDWFYHLTRRFNLHPAIPDAFDYADPYNWQQLLLEWPHKAETDINRLAYTRDERAGEADKQTVTTIGKYLARHFDLSDHIIRDIAARYTATGHVFKFLNTTDAMVHAVNNGPYSCMCWRERDDVRCSDGHARHPYEVYDPKYGWHMAVRIAEEGRIDARAMCNVEGEQKYFVRSYKRDPGGGYSYSDDHLEAWLKAQGYLKDAQWHEGARMAYFETSDDFLAPYIDGDRRDVYVHPDGYLVIDGKRGDYCCDNTDGTPSGGSRTTCDDCGEREHDDNMTYVGCHDDRYVCSACLENDYTYVTGRRGNTYYVSNDYAVFVESQGEYYDEDYLADNDIVCLENGDYEHIDNAVEVDGDWYHNEDDDIVYDDFNERYQLTDNCTYTEDMGHVHTDDVWQCHATDNWYTTNIEPVTIDGETYHPDNAPETESNEE
jgi:hypothetical protein